MSSATANAAPNMALSQSQKKRPLTYGKAGRANPPSFSQLGISPPKAKVAGLKHPRDLSRPNPSVQAMERGYLKGKLGRPSSKHDGRSEHDVFDIPLSDDDRAAQKKKRVDTRLSSPSSLDCNITDGASRDSVYSTNSEMRKRKRSVDSAEAQLLRESTTAMQKFVEPFIEYEVKPKSSAKAATNTSSSQQYTKQRAVLKTHAERSYGGKTGNADLKALSNGTKTVLKPLKGHSAPTQLRDMVLSSPPSSPISGAMTAIHKRQSPQKARFESHSSPSTPPSRTSTLSSTTKPGSSTPRQKELFGKLLGEASDRNSPSNLPVRALHISSQIKLGLLRSASDIAPIRPTQRTRLIDTLGKIDANLEEDDDSIDDTVMTTVEPKDVHVEKAVRGSQLSELDGHTQSQTQGAAGTTYGMTRTYLEESILDNNALFNLPLRDELSDTTTGGRGLPAVTSKSQGSLQDDEDFEDNQGAMKSVHELRAKGGNERFADDFYNLLQDIRYRGTKPLSRQRLGIVELCKKLTNKKDIARMLDHGLDQQLFQACSDITDPIFCCLLAGVLAMMVQANAPVASLRSIHQSSSFDALFGMLGDDRDIAAIGKERQSNMSMMARSTLADVRKLVLEQPFWGEERPTVLSPFVMALKALEGLLHHLRTERISEALIDEENTARLLAVLEEALMHPSTNQNHIEMIMRVLESGSVIPGRMQNAWTAKHRARLASITPAVLGLTGTKASAIAILTFQLVIDLTNDDAESCEQFAEAEIITLLTSSIITKFTLLTHRPELTEQADTAEDAKTVQIVDYLILALGLISTIAEHCDAARTPVCADDRAPIKALVAAFLTGRERAAAANTVQATQVNIPFAWLAVALGNLCQNRKVRTIVAKMLPGGNMSILVLAIEEFATYNRKLEEDMYRSNPTDLAVQGVTGRLISVAEQLRKAG